MLHIQVFRVSSLQLRTCDKHGNIIGLTRYGQTTASAYGVVDNVQEVIIQGGKRTTGKYKGTVPSPIKIKIN